jgi:hypothetical protein
LGLNYIVSHNFQSSNHITLQTNRPIKSLPQHRQRHKSLGQHRQSKMGDVELAYVAFSFFLFYPQISIARATNLWASIARATNLWVSIARATNLWASIARATNLWVSLPPYDAIGGVQTPSADV